VRGFEEEFAAVLGIDAALALNAGTAVELKQRLGGNLKAETLKARRVIRQKVRLESNPVTLFLRSLLHFLLSPHLRSSASGNPKGNGEVELTKIISHCFMKIW
jgi:hypothetical protein